MDTRIVAVDSDFLIAMYHASQNGFPSALDAITGTGRLIAVTSTIRAEVASAPDLFPQDAAIASWIDRQKLLGNVKVYNTPSFPPGQNRGEASILSALSRMHSDGAGGAVQVYSNDADARALLSSSELADAHDTQTGVLISWTEGALSLREYFSLSVAAAGYAGPPRFEPFFGEVLNTSDGHSVRILPNGRALIVDGTGRTYIIDANQKVRFNPDGTLTEPDGSALPDERCFVDGTMIDMWPLDSGLMPDARGLYDEELVRSAIWKKPIEEITLDDTVVSFDRDGNLQPGKVTRTFVKGAEIVLDFFGTGVTPGHVYYRPDSKKADKFETLIDILRDDGLIENRNGEQIRAATGAPLDDPRDRFVWVVTGDRTSAGAVIVKSKGKLRLGTRFFTRSDEDLCIGDVIEAGGGTVTEEGLIRLRDSGTDMPFHWTFGDHLPSPEDYLLKRSGTTLEDIYKAAEWESQWPQMPPPVSIDGRAVEPLLQDELAAMPRSDCSPSSQRSMFDHSEHDSLEEKARKGAKDIKETVH